MNQTRAELKALKSTVKNHGFTLAGLVGLMWGLEILDTVLGGSLDRFGIRPRVLASLPGILAAPFLHGGFGHLISNTVPFAILGWFVMLRGLDEFWVVTAIVALGSGLGTWLFGGTNTLHIGASGVVFGYLGFLVARGYFERSMVSMGIAIITGIMFGGMIWGVLPTRVGISWEGHLFGVIGGIIGAWLFSKLPPEESR
jgi:membrane associated rhomboid family serine protease